MECSISDLHPTNTFEEVECRQGSFEYDDGMEENRARRKRQKKTRIDVITGNPPWSVGKDESVELDGIKERVRETYATPENCTRRQKAGLYDKYILAMRWATDKLLASGGEGVMAFVTNAGWVGGDAAQGVRRCMSREFAEVEIFDLRGNANTSGEVWQREGAKVFGQASKAPVCLVTATMRREHTSPARVKYHAVGDRLSLQEKLKQVKDAKGGKDLTWTELSLDEHGDWLNQRNEEWEEMVPLGRNEVRSRKEHENSVFRLYSSALKTSDDGRVYAATREELIETMPKRIEEYNRYAREGRSGTRTDDESLVKWHRDLQKAAEAKSGGVMEFDESKIRKVMYRAFITNWVYFEKGWCAQREHPEEETRYLCVGGQGEKTGLTVLMTRDIPDLGIFGKVQVFAEHEWADGTRKSNIVDWYMEEVRRRYPSEDFTRSDVFNFVYGKLHDPAYRAEFNHETMKDIGRLDWPGSGEEFAHWSIIGSELSELHLSYEEAEEYPLAEEGEERGLLDDRWKWGMPDQPRWLDKDQKTRLKWNGQRVLAGFPEKHVEWRLGYHDALTGLIQGLVNNPRDAESKVRAIGDPEFWVKILRKVVSTGQETIRIVKQG